jgi:hypothetical protein
VGSLKSDHRAMGKLPVHRRNTAADISRGRLAISVNNG